MRTVLDPWRPGGGASVSLDVHSLDVSESFWCKCISALYLCKNPKSAKINSVHAGRCPASKRTLVDGATEKTQKLKGVTVDRVADTWSQRMYSALLFVYSFDTEVLVSL